MRRIIASVLAGLILAAVASGPAHAQGWLDSLFGNYDHRYGGDPWDNRYNDRDYRHNNRPQGQYNRPQGQYNHPRGQYNRSYPPQQWHGSTPGSFNGPTVEHGQ